MRYRPEIDGLRAVAVIPVVLYHAGWEFFSGGYVGVDIFFVISGFLITGIIRQDLESGRFSLARFYERRCRRILPPLIPMVLAATLIAWMWLLPRDFQRFGRSLAAMATFWANVYFYRGAGYFDAESTTKPLLHTWSLSVEEQFYLIFPVLLAFLFHRFRSRLVLILFGLGLASLWLSAVLIKAQGAAVFYLLPFRAWELLLGALVAVGPQAPSGWGRGLKTIFSLAALALMVGPVLMYTPYTLFPGLAALPPCLGTALFIFAHGRGTADSPFGRLLGTTIPVGIGKISYSLYLWHWPILIMPRYVRGAPLAGWENAVLVAVSIAAAVWSWRFVEQPVRARRVFRTRRRVFAAAVLALVLLIAGGRVIKWADGFPQRLTSVGREYAAAEGDFGQSLDPYKTKVDQRWAGLFEAGPKRLLLGLGRVKSGAPDFLLLGDSHARTWAPAFDYWGERFGVAGCISTPACRFWAPAPCA